MNCAECKELLVAYVEGLLDETEKRSVAQHLKDCAACGAELEEINNLRRRLIQNGKTLAHSDLEDKVLDRIVREQNVRLKAADKAGIALKIRKIIMKSPIAKLAAAAVIIIAVIVGINHFIGPVNVTSVALADVLERIEQAQAFMYKMKMKMTGSMGPIMPAIDMDMETTMIISRDFGIKTETITVDGNTGEKSTQTAYVIPHEGIAVTLIPDKKKYMQMEFDDDWLAKMKQQNNDPRDIIKRMMGSEYTKLGRSVVDGVEVDGFQTTDPTVIGGVAENVTLTLWVDAESWLPVRSEIEFKVGDQMQVHVVVSEFNWDIPVTADDFKPVIPHDFEPMAAGMQMPKISEEGLIEGLRLFAELSGSYPKNLSMMEVAQEAMAFMTNRDVLEKIAEKIPRARELDKDELMMKVMQITKPLQSPAFFYMMLVQDKKEPAYYGESVAPGDVGSVLLRWKISDNQYRVIFGDLHAETVTPEKLAELEAALRK
jgi:predicted anti-sigma-YlaC factor YlaD